MKRKVLYYILSVICLVASSCVRDDVDSAGGMSEGECIVSAAVDFKPLTAGLDGGTRTAGDAVKSIDNLCVLFYDNDNKLVQTCYLEEGEGGYTLSEEERTGSGIAERTTPRATFRMKVAYGSYRIYVAANMGDLSAQEKYAEAIKTVDGLKSIRLAWDEAIADNREMFGFFGSGDQSTFEAPAVVIDSATTTMQAWIRRCVSKLTVAYDATGLKDNVAIYIHSVQIRDIPAECYLGQKNTPSAEELIAEGEMWEYEADAADRLRRGIYLSNGPNTSSGGSDHGEKEAASLFFFENMQDKEGPLKWQDKTGNNSQVSYPDSWKPGEEYYKDNVAAGTYVEVKGYYVSDNPERIGHGEITYRFMLGKDVDRNYEAERNHHYKLTLIFNGFANDIDWHIEYIEPDPGVYVKSPQYISYIYDRTMNVNIKVVGKMIGGLHAEILENHWWPDDADNTVYYQKPGDVRLTEDATGFLSLKRAWRTVLGAGVSWQNALDFSKNYYYDNGGDPRYIREYVNTHGSHDQSSLNGGYSVRVEEDVTGLNGGATRTFTIPLYTRARSICPTTGYTGNNVYTGYQRTAKIRFYADIEYMGVTKTYADTVEIHQVHRMVNPTGIWRSADNSDPFEVKLMYLDNDKATSFTELISEGPWYAEIASGDWFTLQPVGQSVSGQNGTVMGGDRTKIEFKYVPDGAPGGDNVRCGVIRVYYHNNTCVHLIFVRQGYAPLALKSGEAKWHSFNVQAMSVAAGTDDAPQTFVCEETTDPRDEGTYFKWRQAVGILAENNRKYGWGANPWGGFSTSDGRTGIAWDDIKAKSVSDGGADSWVLDKESEERLPTFEDYNTLIFNEDTNPNIQYGFGVLYCDGADSPAVSVADAYGFYGDQPGSRAKGMRGCFVYNDITGDNIFFPIGVEGHGRRKDDRGGTPFSTQGEYIGTGVLRYASRHSEYNTAGEIEYRPMLFDIYKREGAVYWCRDLYRSATSTAASGWDINYHTLNFDTFLGNAYSGDASRCDACMLRLVSPGDK